ncbi:20094_t:CDS:1 [Racocetra fulgida]|uniref:20094_t:CDS:1 n=1 Tax=Racocetra fulgida TaxID=60492 RepID=A0A9N8ZM61_9GLOM|nr:20094_t:CDS:1 [Racocetra fulgida]
MSVVISTHLIIKDTDCSESNKCPLKVSFVGTPQGKLSVIENTENSIIEILTTDYISVEYSYIINVVFSHTNPRFENLKSAINLQESVIFVVGQMKVIDSTFYVNAKDINYISIKKKISEADSSQNISTPTNSTRSKLLNIHQNIAKNSKNVFIVKLQNSNDTECEPSAKCKKSEESYKYIEDLPEVENVDSTVNCEPEITENNLAKNNKPRKNLTRNRKKGKECPIRTTEIIKPRKI